ncbi:5'-nucleotidase [Limnohabitans sp. Jir72]
MELDEAMFLCGLHQGEFLLKFGLDLLFDEPTTHIESAAHHAPARPLA